MLDTYRIQSRLAEIEKQIRLLEKRFKPLGKEELINDEVLNLAAEKSLQNAIQACIDIANHIVAACGLERSSESVADVFFSLAKEGIIHQGFAETMKEITGYRNVIVHDYLDVDRNITYDSIQNHLPDLSKFAQYIEKFLEKQEREKAS